MDEQNFHDPECRTRMEIKKNKAHATIGLSFAMMIRHDPSTNLPISSKISWHWTYEWAPAPVELTGRVSLIGIK